MESCQCEGCPPDPERVPQPSVTSQGLLTVRDRTGEIALGRGCLRKPPRAVGNALRVVDLIEQSERLFPERHALAVQLIARSHLVGRSEAVVVERLRDESRVA